MGQFLAQRQRHIRAKGRPMILRRTGQADIALRGYAVLFKPEHITGAIKQGDQRVGVLAGEIAAAAWPTPPRNTDFLVVEGKTWSVQGVDPKYDGAALIGFELWIRGGAQ